METTRVNIVRRYENIIAGGSVLEAFGGAAAIGLAIIGLSQLAPYLVVSLAAIALGAALMVESGLMMAGYSTAVLTSRHPEFAEADLGGGVGLRAIAGLSVVVLGVLGTLGLFPVVLTAVSAIVLGTALIFSTGLAAEVRWVRIEISEGVEAPMEGATRVGVSATTGMQMLAGLAAIVLGIIALAGYSPLVLTLIALLAIGGSILFTGGAVSARMAMLSAHHKAVSAG